jgi:signal transduction histidine kinase
LSSALRWYVDGLKERSGLAIELKVPENFERLPNDLELVIFRIVQVSLTNVHRHSGSKTAAIHISRESERVLVKIEDHGKGIPSEKLPKIQLQGTGVGISGMRERLRHFKGELLVESNAAGTTILASLPIRAPQANQSELTGTQSVA